MIIASAVLQGRVLAVSAEVLGGDSWWRHMVQCSAAQEGRSPALARASCSHRARPAPALYSVFSAQLITAAQLSTLAADMEEVVARLEALVAKIDKCGAQGPQLGQVTWCRCWWV